MPKLFEYTATGRYYKVYLDGQYVSQHSAEREAIERANEIRFDNPDADVRYIHEYEVVVGLTDAGVTEAQSYGTTDQPPTISSTPAPYFVQGTASSYDLKNNVSDDGESAVTYSLSNTLPDGLSLVAETGILSYDGVAGLSVSSHQLTATDAVGSAQSSSFDITVFAGGGIEDESDVPGNIYEFGAVGDGVADDTAAVQAWVDSVYPAFGAPGYFRLTAPITITRPKLINCFGHGVRTGFNDRDIGSAEHDEVQDEQTRFLIDHTGNAFVFDSSEVHWSGGLVDTQPTLSHSAAAFLVKPQGRSFGGSIRNTRVTADFYNMRESMSVGTNAIEFDFANAAAGERLEGFQVFDVESRGCSIGFHASPKTGSQVSRGHRIDRFFSTNDRLIVDDRSSDDSFFYTKHQAGLTFNNATDANTFPSTRIDGTGNYIHVSQQGDFARGGPSYWRNFKNFLFNSRVELREFRHHEYGSALGLPSKEELERDGFAELDNYDSRNYDFDSGGLSLTLIDEADILDATSQVNVFGKGVAGESAAIIAHSGSRMFYVALGPNPTDSWQRWNGTDTLTPS